MKEEVVQNTETASLHQRLEQEAEASGYHLNPDRDFARELVHGLLVNQQRYGYQSCPCRLGSGDAREDLDIVCPCDYRDADLAEWGACYCALYVADDVLQGRQEVRPVPERRPPSGQRAQDQTPAHRGPGATLPLPVWRCRVCGYLCAREHPPATCPICKAGRERFERFW